MIDVEGLRQVFERAALEGRYRAVEVRIRGHDDDRDLRMPLLHFGQQLEARFARHADVGDEHLRFVQRERLPHLVGGGERLVGNALARERLLEHPADRAVVVDDPYGVLARAGRGGALRFRYGAHSWTPTLAAGAAALPPERARFRAASLHPFAIGHRPVSAAAHARSRALRAWASPCSRGRPRGGPAALIAAVPPTTAGAR